MESSDFQSKFSAKLHKGVIVKPKPAVISRATKVDKRGLARVPNVKPRPLARIWLDLHLDVLCTEHKSVCLFLSPPLSLQDSKMVICQPPQMLIVDLLVIATSDSVDINYSREKHRTIGMNT